MSDSIDTLEQSVGLSREAMLEIAAQVKENHARLASCQRHLFEPIPGCAPLRQRYRCVHCTGEVDHHALYWHQIGQR